MLPAIHSYVHNSNLLFLCVFLSTHILFKIGDYCVHVTPCSLEKNTAISEDPPSPN